MNNPSRMDDQLSFRSAGGAGKHSIDHTNLPESDRGGFGHSGQSGVPGGQGDPDSESSTSDSLHSPHSVHGFRSAIEKEQSSQNGKSSLLQKVRMNRFAQGSSKTSNHGLHIRDKVQL